MTLTSQRIGRERILLFGNGGTGKSSTIKDIAARIDGIVHVIDTDYAFEVMLDGEPDEILEHIECHPVDCDDWEGLMATVAKVNKLVGPDDWMVIDSMTATWDAVSENFVEKVFGKSTDEYFLAARQATSEDAKKLQALEGWKDYTVINKMYNKLYKEIYKCRGHVLLTAEATALGDDDKGEAKDMFGRLGRKPKGQKRLSYVTHTVIYMVKRNSGEWKMTTVKDRQRDEMIDLVWGDFAQDYLADIGGWLDDETETVEEPAPVSAAAAAKAKALAAKGG